MMVYISFDTFYISVLDIKFATVLWTPIFSGRIMTLVPSLVVMSGNTENVSSLPNAQS